MRKIYLLLVVSICTVHLFAQKKPIDYSTCLAWPYIGGEKISNNGNFVGYKVVATGKFLSFVVQDVQHGWKREINNATGNYQFSEDSRWLVFTTSDSIGILNLQQDSLHYIPGSNRFSLSYANGDSWLACTSNGRGDLSIVRLSTQVQRYFTHVLNHLFSPAGDVLLMELGEEKKGTPHQLIWYNLLQDHDTVISTCPTLSKWVFDQSGYQVAFLSSWKAEYHTGSSLHYYQRGMDTARTLIDSSLTGRKGMTVSNKDIFFSEQGDKLFFFIDTLNQTSSKKPITGFADVKILSYLHDSLESDHQREPYLSVIQLANKGKIVQLGQFHDKRYQLSKDRDTKYMLVRSNGYGNPWLRSARPDFYLVEVATGRRTLLLQKSDVNPAFSWGGNFLIWYDPKLHNWFTYDIASGRTKNITQQIPAILYQQWDFPGPPDACGLGGWLADDKAVLVYDRRDIWKVDPNGRTPPVNLTGGHDHKHQIHFRCITGKEGNSLIFPTPNTLLVAAMDDSTKDSGFFTVQVEGTPTPTKLYMGHRFYYFPEVPTSFSGEPGLFRPVPAKTGKAYLVKGMTGGEYPNLYHTTDFKEFKALSDLTPQRDYNWYTVELIHWPILKGKQGAGLLYKPQNFDPGKKYPVIFYYYEKNSSGLNMFLYPELSDGPMNIPWFVSRGYVVVVPDIEYPVGDPGSGVYNSIVSAARYIATFSWIDVAHMGLQGHSHGGWETNYIVTHTSMFSAAIAVCGVSDWVSAYGEIRPGYYEGGQGRMGGTLWEKRDAYIKNSPIFRAAKVTTPLLIINNQKDSNVPYLQGKEFFTALSRLRRKAWLLLYENEGHVIDQTKNKLDFTRRMEQFFDHFLKETPPPRWITEEQDN